MRKTALVILLAVAAIAQTPSYDQLRRDARTAYEAKDYPRLLTVMQRMDVLRPNHPTILTNLAGSYALNGNSSGAIAVLSRLDAMKVYVDLSDHDFDSLRSDARFSAIATRMTALRTQRVSGADVAFRIPQKGLITEGLAYDATTGNFFVSSARKGKIVKIDRAGHAADFATPPEVHGLSGMGIDAKRHLLWACSSASPRVESFKKDDPTDASIIAVDIRSGKLVKRVRPSDADTFCDDLTVASDGTVYVSDSTGSILKLAAGSDTIETLVAKGRIRSPQGSTLSADESLLYVADYGGPIRAVDVHSGDVAPLRLPEDFQSMGIDGLTRSGNRLIAVQNGVEPNRIVSLDLGPDRLTVTRWKILEMNHPKINEPTIGKAIDNRYYFVGASEGNKFDRGTPDAATLGDGLIFVIPLR